ncbi:MAG: hypothetical protein ABI548_03985, partial [Polyangiaceae bacterium]
GGQPGGGGGAFSVGGASGSGGAAASSGDSGGMSGRGGQSTGGGGGRSGTGGRGGTGGTGGTGGGTAPTWSQIYTKFFNNSQYSSNCAGSQCHNPGRQKNIDFSSQANGYTSVKGSLSKVTSVVSNGSMPLGRPKMPAADLATFKAWVAAGALNN